MTPGPPLHLGIDVSTQGVKLVAVDPSFHLVNESSLSYDRNLPSYGTSGGVLRRDGGVVVTPSALFAEALGMLLDRLKDDGFPFGDVVSVSGCGQQHGSVYLTKGGVEGLAALDPGQKLGSQVGAWFSTKDSPIWMDSSTSDICRQLEAAVGGKEALCSLTGSIAYERFTGNQIRKLGRDDPAAYRATERICLVSSFAASLFLQSVAPIDASDAAGMNLMDIRTRTWDPRCLDFADADGDAARLEAKLGPIVPSCAILGVVGPYFRERYGFSAGCKVVAFAGDNPSSLSALPLSPTDLVVSLGTSDTAFLALRKLPPAPMVEATVLAHPVEPEGYLAMLVYKNGSLVRERVRDGAAGGSWETFERLVARTPPGCDGTVGFYCPDPEILPAGVVGWFRFRDGVLVDDGDAFGELDPRACVESRFLDLRMRAGKLGIRPGRIVAVGGGSRNAALLQVAADVFGAEVFKPTGGGEAAAFGGCARGVFALQEAAGEEGTGTTVSDRFAALFSGTERGLELVCQPDTAVTEVYERQVLPAYERAETEVRRLCSR
ncbi:xylulose kinase-like protein [Hyaloraphidium curvatum]|nr:xylulose kinase-like protein [Hyaloraphidium curvatum]